MAAMGRKDQVGFLEMRHDACWDRLLPDRQVDRAKNQLIAGCGKLCLFLEGADPFHHCQQGETPALYRNWPQSCASLPLLQ